MMLTRCFALSRTVQLLRRVPPDLRVFSSSGAEGGRGDPFQRPLPDPSTYRSANDILRSLSMPVQDKETEGKAGEEEYKERVRHFKRHKQRKQDEARRATEYYRVILDKLASGEVPGYDFLREDDAAKVVLVHTPKGISMSRLLEQCQGTLTVIEL